MLSSLVPQPSQRGVDVLAPHRERLTHDLYVPRAATLVARRAESAHPACNLGGRGRVSHQADVDRLHLSRLPTALAKTREPSDHGPLIGWIRTFSQPPTRRNDRFEAHGSRHVRASPRAGNQRRGKPPPGG